MKLLKDNIREIIFLIGLALINITAYALEDLLGLLITGIFLVCIAAVMKIGGD